MTTRNIVTSIIVLVLILGLAFFLTGKLKIGADEHLIGGYITNVSDKALVVSSGPLEREIMIVPTTRVYSYENVFGKLVEEKVTTSDIRVGREATVYYRIAASGESQANRIELR